MWLHQNSASNSSRTTISSTYMLPYLYHIPTVWRVIATLTLLEHAMVLPLWSLCMWYPFVWDALTPVVLFTKQISTNLSDVTWNATSPRKPSSTMPHETRYVPLPSSLIALFFWHNSLKSHLMREKKLFKMYVHSYKYYLKLLKLKYYFTRLEHASWG